MHKIDKSARIIKGLNFCSSIFHNFTKTVLIGFFEFYRLRDYRCPRHHFSRSTPLLHLQTGPWFGCHQYISGHRYRLGLLETYRTLGHGNDQ